MPLVNIYSASPQAPLPVSSEEIKKYVAAALTCGDIKLTPEEISVRYLASSGSGMIAPIEVVIMAHAFPERVAKQDELCLDIMRWLESKGVTCKVWLALSELGHSW